MSNEELKSIYECTIKFANHPIDAEMKDIDDTSKNVEMKKKKMKIFA